MNERIQLEQAIAALEAQRGTLGDTVVDPMIAAAREKLDALNLAAAPESTLKGERKLVTVMFADIAGFTALADTMDPEAVRDLMNGCFERLVPVIEKYEGTLDKFMGDAIMALFGAPVTHENDPERALRAALEMVQALGEFNDARNSDLGLHIGINTGMVVAGGIGSEGRQEYSVMGDAVNLASRLEDVSERGQILVGPDTYRLTAPFFDFEALEPVQVKGKTEPVPIYHLLASKSARGRVRTIAGLDSPLVGRETEMATLQALVARLQTGEGGIVTLVGEAGLGKSRLVSELHSYALQLSAPKQLSSPPHLRWAEGCCLSYGGALPYLLWLDVLRGLLGVTAEDTPANVRDALLRFLEGLSPRDQGSIYPYLGRLLSVPLEEEIAARLADLEGESLKSATFRAVEMLLEQAAREHPLVLACEDLHWADPTSIELLEQLLPLIERVPLLLIAVFRPHRDHGCWRIKETAATNYPSRHVDIEIDSLSAAESRALMGNLIEVKTLPSWLGERILERAEGNPFFVEEIIRSLIDDQVIVYDKALGCWQTTRETADVAIPDSLQGVLAARVDRLQHETKRVLQLAAVIGRFFLYRVLAAITTEEQTLNHHLTELEEDELIRERARTPELEYTFKHHLTREAAYNGLLKKEQRAFHRQVAETLERLFSDRIEEQLGLLAYHWEQAEQPEKAVEYLSRAGDRARLTYSLREAIDYYQRALALLREIGEQEGTAQTLLRLGLAHNLTFNHQAAREAWEESFDLWRRLREQGQAGLPTAPHPLRLWWQWREPQTLDPALNVTEDTGWIIQQLFSGLVERSTDLNIFPAVARSWEVSDDGCRYVFHLREDVNWSDGTAVTAHDFEYTWKRVLDPATGAINPNIMYDIVGAELFHSGEGCEADVGLQARDDTTLVVQLQRPTAYFLQLLPEIPFLPVPRHAVEANGASWADAARIVTNGPFRPGVWHPGESMTLSRNPDFSGTFPGNLQEIEMRFDLDRQAAVELYADDRIEVLTCPGPEVEQFQAKYGGQLDRYPRLMVIYLVLNTGRPPFDDPRVRRAFVLATDRKALAAMHGDIPASGGFVPPGMAGHSPGIGLPYDPEQARQLLTEAGYPGGDGLPNIRAVWNRDEWLTAALQQQWQDNLGVCISWDKVPRMRIDERAAAEWHLCEVAWTADYPDPDSFLRMAVDYHRYQSQWRNAAYDDLIARARENLEPRERMALYRQADRILTEHIPIMPLYCRRVHLFCKPWVKEHPKTIASTMHWKNVFIQPH